MVGAVAAVATHKGPSSSANVVTSNLDAMVRTLSDILADTPNTEGCAGDSLLERAVVEAASGNPALWKRKAGKLAPSGTATSLYLDNGRALYPLAESDPRPGSAFARTWLPSFEGVHPDAIQAAAPTGVLIVDTFPLAASKTMSTKGEAVRLSATISSGLREHTSSAWAASALTASSSSERASITNLSWRIANQDALTHAVGIHARDTAVAFSVGGDVIGHGDRSSLQVTVPSEWLMDSDTVQVVGYATIQTSTDAGGERTLLASNLQPGAAEIRVSFFALPPPTPSRLFDTFTARLDNGSYGQSTLVVRHVGATERDLPRAIYPTVQYPLRTASYALFGAAFANGGDEVTITQFEIDVPGGYDLAKHGGRGAQLFREDAFELLDGSTDGTWSFVDGKHLRWVGSRVVEAGGVTEWRVGVPITMDVSQTTSIERDGGVALESTLRFANGFTHRSTAWGASPGILRHVVPPDDLATEAVEGYSTSATPASFEATARVANANAGYESTFTYNVTPAAAETTRLQHAVANASFQVRDRLVPLGDVLVVDADMESLAGHISRAGAAQTTLRVDMYAPPTLSCGPVATWTQTESALPLAAPVGLTLGSTDGVTPALFLAAQDGYAYRLGVAGALVWRASLGQPAVAFAADASPTTGVFVATADRAVHRLDVTTGATVWSHLVAPRVGAGAGATTVALRYDAALDRVLVAMGGDVVEMLDPDTGALVARREFAAAQGTVLDVAFGPDQGAFARTSTGLLRLGSSLGTAATYNQPVLGMTFAGGANAKLVVTTATATLPLDSLTLAGSTSTAHVTTPDMTASGDATGDGAADHIVAFTDKHVEVYDGRDGSLVWTIHAPLVPLAGAEDSGIEFLSRAPPGFDKCVGPPPMNLYGSPRVCDRVGMFDGTSRTLALAAADEGVAYAFEADGLAYLLSTDGETVRWVRADPASSGATVLGKGAYLATPTVVVAQQDGRLVLRHFQDGSELASASPTEFVGRFVFATQVPMGAFFGAHLLVATVTWTDAEGAPQSARLLDWFNVVDRDGTPVTTPVYDIVIVAKDRSER